MMYDTAGFELTYTIRFSVFDYLVKIAFLVNAMQKSEIDVIRTELFRLPLKC